MTTDWRRRDPFELLEVHPEASDAEVKAAFRLQQQAWHPDKFRADAQPEVSARSAAISAAYKSIETAALRRRLARDRVDLAAETQFEVPAQNVGRHWKRLSAYLREEDLGTSFQRRIAYTTGDRLERGYEITEKMRPHALEVWQLAIDYGYDPEAEEVDA